MAWFLAVVVLISLAGIAYSVTRKPSPARFCTACGTLGSTRTTTRGSLAIEILLWICFLVPGLIYSIWRHTTRAQVCASCGSAAVIPPDSPIAAKMRRELGQAELPKP